MDKFDRFVWNEKTGRIDGFIPLDDMENCLSSGDGQPADPEQAYREYLDEAYRDYKDDGYESAASRPLYSDAADAWQEYGADPAGEEQDPYGQTAYYGTAVTGETPRKKRRRRPRMVTFGVLCLCIVLAAVTGALSGIAVMQHYTADNGSSSEALIPEGTHAGLAAISATMIEASLQQTADGAGDAAATEIDEQGGGSASAVTASAADASVIKSVMDSVVCIRTTALVDTFYGPMDASGAGSGVIISENGYIVTCAHVVSGASAIEVQDSENRTYQAVLIAASEKTDLALIKIDAQGLTPAELGDSDSYGPGDMIYVVGNPLGNFVLSVSQGIISGMDRTVNINGNVMSLTQVDAAVNPGNSGGGLFDSQGRLIGVVNAKNTGIDVEGMGFAIPIGKVREVLDLMLQRTDFSL